MWATLSLALVDPNVATVEQTERELLGQADWLERPPGEACLGFCHFFDVVFSFLDAELGSTGKAFQLPDGTVAGEKPPPLRRDLAPGLYVERLAEYIAHTIKRSDAEEGAPVPYSPGNIRGTTENNPNYPNSTGGG